MEVAGRLTANPGSLLLDAAVRKPALLEWAALSFDPASLPQDTALVMADDLAGHSSRDTPDEALVPPHAQCLDDSDMASFISRASSSLALALDAYDARSSSAYAAAAAEAAEWRRYPSSVKSFVADLEAALADRQERWERERTGLGTAIVPLRELTSAAATESAVARRELGRARARIAAAETTTLRLRTALACERAAEDVGRLPKFAIRLIASFLSGREVTVCLRVCRRWRAAFDRGFVWKQLLQTAALAARARLQRQQERDLLASDAALLPSSVTVNLRDPNKKARHMTKPQVFDSCLSQVQQQVSQAQSEREDLTSQAAAETQVREFLDAQLASHRARFGTLIQDKAACERAAVAAEALKAAMMGDISAAENAAEEEEETRKRAHEAATQSLRALQHKLRMLDDAQRLVGGGNAASGAGAAPGDLDGGFNDLLSPAASSSGPRNPFDDDFLGGSVGSGSGGGGSVGAAVASMDELTQQVKQHKKLLVRAVKQLRQDVSAAEQTNAQLEQQLLLLGIQPPPRNT
jgi:hypothetical protein